MKDLPLTILFSEGPLARIYLVAMHMAGFRPTRIIHTIVDPKKKRRLTNSPKLLNSIKDWVQCRRQVATQLYWPRRLLLSHSRIVENIITHLESFHEDPHELFRLVYSSHFNLKKYAPAVVKVRIKNMKDPDLEWAISESPSKLVLYTGGGILPSSILKNTTSRFIHIHPGLLPHVRGADGLLWSTIVRTRPGMSCFYMEPGIDTGDIIDAMEFSEPLNIPLPAIDRPNDILLYRAVFSFIDPLLRAALLLKVLSTNRNSEPFPSSPQNREAGITYHFMHPNVRKEALQKIFV